MSRCVSVPERGVNAILNVGEILEREREREREREERARERDYGNKSRHLVYV